MHLTLHLTDRCNLACRYCYQRHGASDMPRETAEAAIDRLATGNNPGIVFFGGELVPIHLDYFGAEGTGRAGLDLDEL